MIPLKASQAFRMRGTKPARHVEVEIVDPNAGIKHTWRGVTSWFREEVGPATERELRIARAMAQARARVLRELEVEDCPHAHIEESSFGAACVDCGTTWQ